MCDNTTWLPELILLEDHGGDWNAYLDAVYQCFVADFVTSRPAFDGVQLSLKRHPVVHGKEATFWHLIQEGKIEEDRTPDFRRCERIRWPRPVIEQARNRGLKIWENVRKNETRVCLWSEVYEYLVVLSRRRGYILLWTAYVVDRPHTKRKLEAEYQAYIASAAP